MAGLADERAEFRRALAASSWFYHVFDDLPGASFFAKDRRGRVMFASSGILRRYGFLAEEEILGKTDFDLNPSSFARLYVKDDQKIYESGEPIKNRLEPWFSLTGLPQWHLTSKYPLYDERGNAVGIMGIILDVDSQKSLPEVMGRLLPAIRFASKHFSKPVDVRKMAELCGLSVRSLQVHFKESLSVTPQEFVMRLRVDHAIRSMQDKRRDLGEIAIDVGFSDQSAFSRKFREIMHDSPLSYRKRLAQQSEGLRRRET